jgi:hypothetical protein
MWYVFPQFDGLAFSEIAKRYAIKTPQGVRECRCQDRSRDEHVMPPADGRLDSRLALRTLLHVSEVGFPLQIPLFRIC